MKIVQINSVPNGSTGNIMMNIHRELLNQGHESYVVWGRGRNAENDHEIYMNDKFGVYLHVLYSRLTGKHGFASKRATRKLLKKLDDIKPDIIHLHNIHGYYINIEVLFNYLKKKNIKVIWTLHDCWSFTGQCPHFERINCEKWKNGCNKCSLTKTYPKSIIDNSKWNYNKKKELFTGLNLKIITPSNWLAKLVKLSFLKNYEVKVINNGIDTNIFKPTPSNFREKYDIQDKTIILGVSSVWTEAKGYYDFIELSKMLDDSFKIVLVGLNEKQLKEIPNNIIGLTRTSGQKELAEIYTAADVFFNPTYEDTYPTVNIEAIACGTPVVTYNTGGSPEFLLLIKENKSSYITSKKELTKEVFKNKNNISIDVDVNKLNEKEMVNSYLKIYSE